jgi:hypothetical protein
VAQWFADPARGRSGAPDIVAITDETGRVVARSQDPNRMHGTSLNQQVPALRAVLAQGRSGLDVWSKDDENKVLQTAVAPIRSEAGAIIGALVVGYDLSNGLATSESEILGRDVAFVVEGQVYSSSLDNADPLKDHLFGPLSAQTTAALAGEAGGAPWTAELGGDSWVGTVAPLPMSESVPVAYVVMANKTAQVSIASPTNLILYLTVLGAILVLVYGFVIGTSFLRPVEQIEEDVLAVINGRHDLRIDVESAEFGGLAYRINQLINVFTGVSEEDEDGRVSNHPGPVAGWQESTFDTTGGGGGGGGGAAPSAGDVVDDPAVAQQLGAEPEAAYYGRIYQEYVAAKTAIGENVSNIPQDRFVTRLQGNAAALAKKHGVRAVRFQVETRGNQVVLKPVLIR